jgi:pyruvate kinase
MPKRKTKIVATLGPATREPHVLRQLLRTGVDVCRINCSHCDAKAIRTEIAHIRRAAAELGKSVAILLDLQGPKIRVGKMKEALALSRGSLLEIVMDPDLIGTGTRCGTGYLTLASEVKEAQKVLFDDGALAGVVEKVDLESTPAEVHVRIKVGGNLGSNKGMNLPGASLAAPCLTEKDRKDLVVGIQSGVDYVALSFVREPNDVVELKALLKENGHPDLPVISKIERKEAVENIDAILKVSDGIMVARGDLGVELPLETIPIHQKTLIRAANRQGRLVITATQMLDSMERNPRPTRAESTDVANAVLDGTDAIMLSGETAAGLYPIQAVEVMDRIAREAEQSQFFRAPSDDDLPVHQERGYTIAHASITALRDGSPLMVFSWSGLSAIIASKFRPIGPIYALAPTQAVCDRLALAWGVTPFQVPQVQSTDELIEHGEKLLLEKGLLHPGQRVVVLAGSSPMKGATNLMKILIAGEEE